MISVYFRVERESIDQRVTGIENGSERSNGLVNFDRTGPTEKKGGRAFSKLFPLARLNPFQKLGLNGSRPRNNKKSDGFIISPSQSEETTPQNINSRINLKCHENQDATLEELT